MNDYRRGRNYRLIGSILSSMSNHIDDVDPVCAVLLDEDMTVEQVEAKDNEILYLLSSLFKGVK